MAYSCMTAHYTPFQSKCLRTVVTMIRGALGSLGSLGLLSSLGSDFAGIIRIRFSPNVN